MKINRLIGDLPDDFNEYQHYSDELFNGAAFELALQHKLNESQAHSWIVASFLKDNKVWIGSEFYYQNKLFTLVHVENQHHEAKLFFAAGPGGGKKSNYPKTFMDFCDASRPRIYGVSDTGENCKATSDQIVWKRVKS